MSENDPLNPYAPPTARIDPAESAEAAAAPALWNPNAAANWSLVFTPVFGSLLVYSNWKAIGNDTAAKTAQVMFYVSLAVLAITLTLDWRGLALPWLIGWYFASARPQAKYVREHFGKDYPRRAWGRPLGLALLAMLGLMAVLVAIEVLRK